MGNLIARLVALFYDVPRCARGLLRAHVCGLEDSPKRPLRRDRVLCREGTVCAQHAAKIVRPGTILGSIQDDVPQFPRTQLLGMWWEGDERVCLSVRK